jgi:hypothetical protein
MMMNLEAERAKINGRFLKSAREVDGWTIRELRPTDIKPFAQWCDTNYIQQQKTPKTLVSNPEGSARKALSQGTGHSFEACADIQTSKAGHTTTESTAQWGKEATTYYFASLYRKTGGTEMTRI